MNTENDPGRRRIKSIDKASNILTILKKEHGARIVDIAALTGMSKGAIHTYLDTLRQQGFVVREENTYRVGLKFVEYGEFSKQQVNIYDYAVPIVDQLAEQTGELVRLVVEERGWGVFLYKSAGENAVKTSIPDGNREYLHCTAQGKAILANMPEPRVENIVEERGLPRMTEHTITDGEELFDDLERIREKGVAFSNGEITRGLICVASPIKAANDRVDGAIGICGPVSRMQNEGYKNKIAERVREMGDVIQVNHQLADEERTA
jgi:DNA-binding IclR family transcriptional regulator